MIRIRIRGWDAGNGTRSAGGLDGRLDTRCEVRGAITRRGYERWRRNGTNKGEEGGSRRRRGGRYSQQVKPPAFPHSRNSQY